MDTIREKIVSLNINSNFTSKTIYFDLLTTVMSRKLLLSAKMSINFMLYNYFKKKMKMFFDFFTF